MLVGLAKPMALTGGRALAHYEVVVGLNRSKRLILSLDPGDGLRENTLEGFAREWAPTRQVTIVVLPRAGVALSRPLVAVVVVVGRRRASLRAADRVLRRRRSPPRRMLAGAPRGFFLGAATSAHQIEGGTHNDWTEWEKGRYPDGTPHVAGGASAARVADSWNLWRLRPGGAAAASAPTSTAWASSGAGSSRRPAPGTRRPPPATARCSPALRAARHHADGHALPLHAADLGRGARRLGLGRARPRRWPRSPGARGRRVRRPRRLVVHASTSRTCSSPRATWRAQWPPGVARSARAPCSRWRRFDARARPDDARRCARTTAPTPTATATRRASGSRRTCASSIPYSAHPVDGIVAGVADWFYNESFLDAVTLGRVRVVFPRVIDIDEPFPALAGSFDYLGVNYYTRDLIVGHLVGDKHYEAAAAPGRPRNDLGWEIYPEGLYRLLVRYARRGWPLFVTENGVADGARRRSAPTSCARTSTPSIARAPRASTSSATCTGR